MLEITIPAADLYDEARNEFIQTREQTLKLEHSLISISKWESKWKIPFLSNKNYTPEQSLDYIRCMTITQNVNPLVYLVIPAPVVEQVNSYLEDSMTATTLKSPPGGKSNRRIVTSELIYYWMLTLGISIECEKWNLNRLLTLIGVCNAENAPKKKMSTSDSIARAMALSNSRKSQLHSRG
jgi:hypothetical protein